MDNKQKLEVHSVYNIMKYWENKYKKYPYQHAKWQSGPGGGKRVYEET